MITMDNYDVIIAGAGPAGLTAALYCGRSQLRTLIIDKGEPGGQVNLTEEVENYPGLQKAAARTFIESLVAQVKELPSVASNDFQEFAAVKKDKQDCFAVTLKSTIDETMKTCTAQSLIIATGAHPKELGFEGEKELRGRGVSYCGVCDGPFFRDKAIAVIGGGDTALKEAFYLSKFASKVFVVHRRDQLRATKILQERAKNNPKIELVLQSIPLAVVGKQRVEGLRIKNVITQGESQLQCSGVFVFVGYSPDTAAVKDFLKLDEDGFIITDETMKTTQEGVFACGDCRRRPFKQIVTACGEGAIAAHQAEEYITEKQKG